VDKSYHQTTGEKTDEAAVKNMAEDSETIYREKDCDR